MSRIPMFEAEGVLILVLYLVAILLGVYLVRAML